MICTTNNLKYTNTKLIQELAEKNFKKHISENIYPGRGIVIGRNLNNSLVFIFWIMGRSSNSKNRIIKNENGILRTEVADNTKIENKNFIIYNIMRDIEDKIVITNGDHTDIICEELIRGKDFFSILKTEKHENDNPNFTPRISGLFELSDSKMSLAKICRSDFSSECSSYHFSHYNKLKSGYGYCLTTYMSDGQPPPSFTGDPILLPIKGNANEIAKTYWENLNSENKVSLFTRELKSSGEDNVIIINRFNK